MLLPMRIRVAAAGRMAAPVVLPVAVPVAVAVAPFAVAVLSGATLGIALMAVLSLVGMLMLAAFVSLGRGRRGGVLPVVLAPVRSLPDDLAGSG
jgi:hypothetical protein